MITRDATRTSAGTTMRGSRSHSASAVPSSTAGAWGSLFNQSSFLAAPPALRELLGGDVRIVSEDGIPYAEMKNAGLAGVCQITLVAGARFELATFGL